MRTLVADDDRVATAILSSALTRCGIEVTVGDGMPGFIRKSDLSRDRSEQRPDRFAVGERVDAKVTAIDRATRKLTLSIKAREMDEEKRAMAEFGSSDSGASLGDILGAAINRARRQGASVALPPSGAASRGAAFRGHVPQAGQRGRQRRPALAGPRL